MSSIRFLAKKRPLQFLITKPAAVSIDGGPPQEIPWRQEVSLPAPPGNHRVDISFHYMGKPRGGATGQALAGEPGQLVRYRSPFVMTSSGSISTEG